MNNSLSVDILIAFWIIGLISWWNDWPLFAGREVTAYYAVCYSSQACKPSELDFYRTVYRADISTSSVTSWMKENNSSISLYRQCAIKDSSNWSCAPESGLLSITHEMRDGIVHADSQTTWYRWWWLKANAWLQKK